MSFWSTTNPEPLRQYRWYMRFADTNTLNPESKGAIQDYIYALKDCDKPEYKIETSSHVLINHTFNYPKNLVWSPIQVKMISAQGLPAILNNAVIKSSGYLVPPYSSATNIPQTQISKKSAIFSEIKIIQVDEGEYNSIARIEESYQEIETWILKNAFITNIKYGNLSYESENFVDINFTITYDYAILSSLTKKDQESISQLTGSFSTNTSDRAIANGGEASSGITGTGVKIGGITG